MPSYEGFRLKVLKWKRLTFAKKRRRLLNHTDFTIISNNCWGGMIYESYNIPKESPTVGLFFMASDYIKFLSDLKTYILDGKLSFIDPNDSKWRDYVSGDSRFGSYPVGVLKKSRDDEGVEIFFLHYHSKDEAREKWERRCKRINWNKLLVKFNDQNYCTEQQFEQFLLLPFEHKIFFTCKEWKYENNICTKIIKIWQPFNNDCITASHEPFGANRYIDLNSLLNSLGNDK